MRPAVGFALKPQLRVILAKPRPFEDAEQLMCGNGETLREGILEKPSALSSEMALEARVAIVSHAFCLLCFLATSVASSSNCWSAPRSGCRTPRLASPEGHLCPPLAENGQKAGFSYIVSQCPPATQLNSADQTQSTDPQEAFPNKPIRKESSAGLLKCI